MSPREGRKGLVADLAETGRIADRGYDDLAIVAALVFAGRASAGRSTAATVWRVLVAALTSGLFFSALVLAEP
jgi:hypothetical protein